jgi:hypothetical protein
LLSRSESLFVEKAQRTFFASDIIEYAVASINPPFWQIVEFSKFVVHVKQASSNIRAHAKRAQLLERSFFSNKKRESARKLGEVTVQRVVARSAERREHPALLPVSLLCWSSSRLPAVALELDYDQLPARLFKTDHVGRGADSKPVVANGTLTHDRLKALLGECGQRELRQCVLAALGFGDPRVDGTRQLRVDRRAALPPTTRTLPAASFDGAVLCDAWKRAVFAPNA